MKKFYFLFLFALIASISNLYAAEKTVTYTFTSKTWEATCDGVAANWTSIVDANDFIANRLRQVTQSQVLSLQSNILKLRVSQYHGQQQKKARAQLLFMWVVKYNQRYLAQQKQQKQQQ